MHRKKAKAEARRKNDRLEMWRDYINDLASDTDNEYALNMMYSLAIGVFRHWGRTKKKEKANANKSSIS